MFVVKRLALQWLVITVSDLSNISMGIIKCKIPKHGYVTRNYPTPPVVVYYHHPTADWSSNLTHMESYLAYQMVLLYTGRDFHQSSTVHLLLLLI